MKFSLHIGLYFLEFPSGIVILSLSHFYNLCLSHISGSRNIYKS